MNYNMETLRDWCCFCEDVINKNKTFYIYGAGLIYEKIIRCLNHYVDAVLDRRYKFVSPLTDTVIISPNELKNKNCSDMYVLICLNPYKETYSKSAEEIYNSLVEKNIRVKAYTLPFKEIKETGILKWGGKELLIDNLTGIISKYDSKFIRMAYSDIEYYSKEYLRKLYEEPATFCYCGGKIGLENFNNGLIIHENGRKNAVGMQRKVEKRIWLFGDSRVSGMLNENATTIASYLQGIINDRGYNINVINCGIPGRDIERMVYQIENEDILEGDSIFLITGFHEYDDCEDNLNVWCEYLQRAKDAVGNKDCGFFYINLPILLEMQDVSSEELDMLKFFHTTEFLTYDLKQIDKCKEYIRWFCFRNDIFYHDLMNVFANRAQYGHVFINLHHYGPHGHRMIAEAIFSMMQMADSITGKKRRTNCITMRKQEAFKIKLMEMEKKEKEIQRYTKSISRKSLQENDECICGAIVMNANPFTKGHKFLVESALHKVDFLYIFVVSEDKSFFSFKDRFEIVKTELQGNERIKVVPSGKYCISNETFPEYFKKEEMANNEISAERDVFLFGQRIAPQLSIKMRFVGEEPEDSVTRQYNELLKKILPNYGVRVCELKRKKSNDGTIVSGTRTRDCFWKCDWERLEEFVSEQTLSKLRKLRIKYGDCKNDGSTFYSS